MRGLKRMLVVGAGALASLGHAQFAREPLADPGTQCANYGADGWLTIYDGTKASAEKYWWISNASHGNGGNWYVAEDPALVTAGKLKAGQTILWSNQNPGGSGGLLYTQRRYKDVEFMVSTFPGWRNDGGIFLRANGRGAAWQVMMDYQPGKTVGGIWPEGLNAPSQDIYRLDTEIKVTTLALAKWNAADWPTIWDADGFNTIYARVTGTNAGGVKIKAWITDSNHVVTDYSGQTQSALTDDGHIGLQIHAGEGSWQGGPNKYQWMKVRELTPGTGVPICRPTTGIADVGVAAGDLRLDWARGGARDLTVTGFAEGDFTLTLTDTQGRRVATASGRKGPVGLVFHGLDKGVYMVNLKAAGASRSYRAVRF